MDSWSAIKLGNVDFKPNQFLVSAGPCSIESEEQFNVTARSVKSSGARLLRGGMFKLRTSPDSFQGLGENAFEIVKKTKAELELPFISEITDPRQISDLYDLVDVFQVGSRNMHNYSLLKELGKTDKPVLIKRGFSGRIDEWLHSADYVIQGGNERVILCERGIRTFENATRNTFDLNAIAYVKKHHNLPVLADPSHATGDSDLVTPMSLAAMAAGADGLIVEVHPNPDAALSDGDQALTPQQFTNLMTKLKDLAPHFNKTLVN